MTLTATESTTRRQRDYTEAYALLALLCDVYPQSFRHEDAPPLPLKLGVHHEIALALAGAAEPALVALAMRVYCRQWAYLAAMAAPGAMRHTLDGTPLEPVSEEHRTQAGERLAAALERYRSRKIERDGQHVKVAAIASAKPKPAQRKLIALI